MSLEPMTGKALVKFFMTVTALTDAKPRPDKITEIVR